MEEKLAYLRQLEGMARECKDRESFKRMAGERYPDYQGENYLDMTAGFFFP